MHHCFATNNSDGSMQGASLLDNDSLARGLDVSRVLIDVGLTARHCSVKVVRQLRVYCPKYQASNPLMPVSYSYP